MNDARLLDLDLAYARFNALRTVSDPRPSAFRTERVGALVLTMDHARETQSYYNRVVGVDEHTLPELDVALGLLDGAAPRIDVDAHRMTPALIAAIDARGFALSEQLIWLGRTPERRSVSLPVERWTGNAHADQFFDLLAREDGPIPGPIPGETRALRLEYYCTDRFRQFVALIDGDVAGWATMFVHEGAGLLGNAYTFEPYRGCGVHTALVDARIDDAAQLRLDRVVTDVEPDSASQRNAARAGLEIILRQTVWTRGAAT